MKLGHAIGRVTVLALLLLAGCTARPPKPTVITFWQPFEASAYDSLAARFERENPGVRVDVRTIPAAAMRDSIVAALATGSVPDLAVLDSTVMPALLAHGDLSDWSAGVADLRDSLAGWELCSVGDAIYGMPWLLETRVLWYRPDAMARANLDPARAFASWQDFGAAAARLRAAGAPLGLPVDAVMGVPAACLFAYGGLLGPEGRDSLVLDSPEARAAFALLSRVRTSARTATSAELARALAAGRVGALVAPRGLVAEGGGVTCVSLPAADRASGACSGVQSGLVLASFVRSAHKEAALRFARSLAAPASAATCAAVFPGLSPAASTSGAFAEQARRDWTPPAAEQGPARAAVIGAALDAVLFARALPDSTLPGAQARLDALRAERP
ncbi:MAG: ABC transporter substrate-binding protein [Candidatus Eisenbacteria bacterium]